MKNDPEHSSGLLHSFRDAFRGLFFVLINERNARIHLAVSLLVTAGGFILHISNVEWMVLILTIAMVWITEIYNTALERLIDLVHPEWGQEAGICKDISAAGVILSALVSMIVGLLIFGPRLYRAAAAVLN